MLSIELIEKAIKNRGGILPNDVNKVSKGYNISKQSFKNQREIVNSILKKINCLRDSDCWLDCHKENQKHFNFDYFCVDKKEIYSRRGNEVSVIRTTNESNEVRSYIKKSSYFSRKIYHELLVSLVVNTLSDNILRHFVYTYDYDKLIMVKNRPYLDVDDEEETKINIYMERVYNAVTLGEYIYSNGSEAFLRIYYNTVLILRDAYEEIGFVHFDLHTSNIMVQKIPEDVTYKYKRGLPITTHRCIKIIDYGYSSVKYKNNTYKIENNEKKFMGERDNPITDCYKLLIHSYKRIKTEYDDLIETDPEQADMFKLDIFHKIFSFFSTDITIDEMVDFNNKNNHYNNIPKYYKGRGIDKLDEFIDFLTKEFYP